MSVQISKVTTVNVQRLTRYDSRKDNFNWVCCKTVHYKIVSDIRPRDGPFYANWQLALFSEGKIKLSAELARRMFSLTFTPLWTQIQQMTNWVFSDFSQKTDFDISCKLSPLETICMKCQILFSEKKKREENIMNLSSAEWDQTRLSDKG